MMTIEEKIDYNKRCAEFLEIPNLKDYNGDLWDLQRTGKTIYSIRTNNLRFDSDWNYIHEVIDAIEKVGETEKTYGVLVDITTTYIKIGEILIDLKHEKNKNLSKKEVVVEAINQFLILHDEKT